MYNRNAIDVWNICSYRVNSMVMDTPGAAAAIAPVFLFLSFKIHCDQIRASPGGLWGKLNLSQLTSPL